MVTATGPWDTGASSRLMEQSCERAVKIGMRVVGEGDIVSTHG
jgi:hypothetical protein